jgi:hypothetical protein
LHCTHLRQSFDTTGSSPVYSTSPFLLTSSLRASVLGAELVLRRAWHHTTERCVRRTQLTSSWTSSLNRNCSRRMTLSSLRSIQRKKQQKSTVEVCRCCDACSSPFISDVFAWPMIHSNHSTAELQGALLDLAHTQMSRLWTRCLREPHTTHA